jgi:Mycoplasma protein of unknown function, DUF285
MLWGDQELITVVILSIGKMLTELLGIGIFLLVPCILKFQQSAFNCDIGSWDVSKVKFMNEMFYYANFFNQDLSQWNISSVTTADYMFSGASNFNSDLSTWDGE